MKPLVTSAIIVAALLAGCSGRQSSSDSASIATEVENSKEAILPDGTLSLPVLPDTLRDATSRADYIAIHFWDRMPFTDTSRSLDTAFMEQNFANFLSVLSLARIDSAKEAVRRMLDGASLNQDVYNFVADIAEKYLHDPNSPMRSRDLHVLFLLETTKKLTDPARLARANHLLRRGMLCCPGDRAMDFRFIDRSGATKRLSDVAGAENTILIFYDPDCTQCKETITMLASQSALPGVSIVAMDFVGDREIWESTKDSMPQSWTVGYAIDPVEDKEYYIIDATPTIYILDKNFRILAADIPPHQLLR